MEDRHRRFCSIAEVIKYSAQYKIVSTNFEKVIEMLRLEASAIEHTAGRLDAESVEAAIRLLLECKGKVLVLGVGKSGVIAQKIAQTMTSTGTVAVFVHPSDALHGSLGMAAADDVVIALSNSGETDEIVALLPSIESRGLSIISIVGNTDSTLARHSNVVLDASVDKEACPLNLAPTTSTTVALSIGDAVSMALMEAKGLTAEDFAVNHPAGRLGKRLTVNVRSLMHETSGIGTDAKLLEVVKAISNNTLGAVNVTNGDGSLLGIITDGDLRRSIERTEPDRLTHVTAAEIMTKDPITTSAEALAFDALRLMEDRPMQISVLPVVSGEKCIGLIRLHDIVRAGL